MSSEDQKRTSYPRCWHAGRTDEELLKDLISKHARLTGSKLAEELLEHWQNVRSHFVKVMPLQYKQALLVKAGLI